MGRSSRYRSSSRSRSSSYDRHRHRRRDESHSRRSCDYSRCHNKRSRSPRTPTYYPRTRFYGSRENPYKSRVLGVFGLSQSSNEAKLMDIFSPFGAVEHISLIYDAKTGNSRGFGFIYFAKIHEAEDARKTMNGSTIDGRRIRVDFSITRRAHTPTPGVYMGHKSSSSSTSERSRRRTRSYSRSSSSSPRRSSHRHGRSSRRSRSYSR